MLSINSNSTSETDRTLETFWAKCFEDRVNFNTREEFKLLWPIVLGIGMLFNIKESLLQFFFREFPDIIILFLGMSNLVPRLSSSFSSLVIR